MEPYSDVLDLRDTEGSLKERIPYSHALGLAYQGAIEAVATASGRIKYFRELPVEKQVEVEVGPTARESSASVVAATNLGVYRERVREAIVAEDAWGNRKQVSSGEMAGFVWAFHTQERT